MLPLFAAVGLSVCPRTCLLCADEAQDKHRREVRDHLEELIRNGDAGDLQLDLQRITEAEEQAGKQNPTRAPPAEDDSRQRDEAAARDNAVGVGTRITGG